MNRQRREYPGKIDSTVVFLLVRVLTRRKQLFRGLWVGLETPGQLVVQSDTSFFLNSHSFLSLVSYPPHVPIHNPHHILLLPPLFLPRSHVVFSFLKRERYGPTMDCLLVLGISTLGRQTGRLHTLPPTS